MEILTDFFQIWNLLQERKQKRTASLCWKLQYQGKGKYVLEIQNVGQAEARNINLQELQEEEVDIIDENLFPCDCPAQRTIRIPFYLEKDICPDILKIRVTWDDRDKNGKQMEIVFEP